MATVTDENIIPRVRCNNIQVEPGYINQFLSGTETGSRPNININTCQLLMYVEYVVVYVMRVYTYQLLYEYCTSISGGLTAIDYFQDDQG